MRLRDDWQQSPLVFDETFQLQRSGRKEPVMQLDSLEKLQPIAVVSQMVALEPSLRRRIEIHIMFRSLLFTAISPALLKLPAFAEYPFPLRPG